MRTYVVYIMASKAYGTLYIGVTNDIVRRAVEHRDGLVPGFTKKYAIKIFVHFETFADIRTAIQREKSLKRWPRDWKINLIERDNPHWDDLLGGMLMP